MKKFLTLLVTLVLCMACFAGCKINRKGEVSVLWSNLSDSTVVELADSMDRSMYLNRLDYTHYDAEGSAERQMNQLNDVLREGATAVIVNAIEPLDVASMISLAKSKNVPIVFIESEVSESDLASYDKAYLVNSSADYSGEYIAMVKAYLNEEKGTFKKEKANLKKLDSNEDGKISVFADSEVNFVVDGIDADFDIIRADAIAYNGDVELIITKSDERALEVLLELRKNGFNKTELETKFVGLFTVGMDLNAGPVIDDGKERTGKDAEDYANKLKHYSIMNAIDDGFINGAVVLDDDTITGEICSILAKHYKDKPIDASKKNVSVKYTTYGVSIA